MNFVLKGNICYSKSPTEIATHSQSYLVSQQGISQGVFSTLPDEYKAYPLIDVGDQLIIPGLTDLHAHAPQFEYRTLGMDLELLDWLRLHTFPTEAKYADITYAAQAYTDFVRELHRGPNTRAAIFATPHVPATLALMDKLEDTGLVTYVGKVNMDRNSPDNLQEAGAHASVDATRVWLEASKKYERTFPILTPRFIPSCSDTLLEELGKLAEQQDLPVQSHLSENPDEIAWVNELVPQSQFYGDAYSLFGLFGQHSPTIMAHGVWSSPEEIQRMADHQVFLAHCPNSNMNLASGIAPVRRFLEAGVPVGLGSDMAAGTHLSIFRAMTDALQVSNLYWRLVDSDAQPLTVPEVFYLGTAGGGAFFGKVGSFAKGYELDALVLNDQELLPQREDFTLQERLTRLIYLSQSRHITAKFVAGRQIF